MADPEENLFMAFPSSLAIDFGLSNEEINVRYWETYYIIPPAECLDNEESIIVLFFWGKLQIMYRNWSDCETDAWSVMIAK